MGGPWVVDGHPKEKFSCFGRLCNYARMVARNLKKPVLVKYLGPRGGSGNRDLMRTNFLMFPGGRKDPAVDPSWWTHDKRKGRGKG